MNNYRVLYDKIMNGVSKTLNKTLNPQEYVTNFNFEKDTTCDYKEELERMNASVTNQKEDGSFSIEYIFGKNGQGITKELILLGKEIYKISQTHHVYLNDPHFDNCDDVYDFTIDCIPFDNESCIPKWRKSGYITEGAWGYEPWDSDHYWDETHHVTEQIIKQLIEGLQNKNDDYKYTYMGLTVGLLSAEHIWKEVAIVHEDDEKRPIQQLINAFNDTYEILNNDTENIQGWDDFNKYKNELNKIKKQFDKIIEKYNK